jgi:hypothetical protein
MILVACFHLYGDNFENRILPGRHFLALAYPFALLFQRLLLSGLEH